MQAFEVRKMSPEEKMNLMRELKEKEDEERSPDKTITLLSLTERIN